MFKQIGAHAILYWCQGTDDVHSLIVQVPRNQRPWERVSCPDHRVWAYQDQPAEIEEAQDEIRSKT